MLMAYPATLTDGPEGTVMVRFPDENHELSRSGKSWHRVERLQHIVGWFDKWLLGREIPTYDVGSAAR